MAIDQTNKPIIYHSINPSLFEVTASKVAYYLFPENFAGFKFITKPDMNTRDDIDAGYIPSEQESSNCEGKLEGVENVYATAFYLGLEIQSYRCVKSGDKTNLFINDFSHAFHKIDPKHKSLVVEYRDHKNIPSEKGTLFPTSFINSNCGDWINQECDLDKLNKAYNRIVSAPQEEIKGIISTTRDVLQSIECVNDQEYSCKDESYYKFMEYKAGVLASNFDSITLLHSHHLHNIVTEE